MKSGIITREKVSFNIARLKVSNERFEIVVDPDNAIAFRQGKELPIDEVCKAFQVFKDANKGITASNEELQKAFSTTDFYDIAKRILKEGDIQLTTSYREKLREKKTKEIMEFIRQQAVDPKTKLPIPIQRLELAFKQAHITVNEFKRVSEQVDNIIKRLRPFLPLSIQVVRIQIIIPVSYASKIYGWLKRYLLKQERWLTNGDFQCIVEIPAGLKTDFLDELNRKTHGDIETKILE